MKGRAIIGAGVAVLAGLVIFVLVQMANVGKDGKAFVGVNKAEATCKGQAPECLPELDMIDIQGQVFTPDLLRGQVVVVNFWATWCKPCLNEIPALAKVQNTYKDRGVYILGVMNDEVPQEQLESFQKQTGMNFPVIRVDDPILRAFQYPEALPTTFVYARDGRLELKKRGAIEEAELAGVLDRLLAEASPSKSE